MLGCLPIELLERVFTLACTDGGRTGCCLSLVSRSVRDASRPVRFHSIALVPAEPPRVAQLLSCLTRSLDAAEQRPNVASYTPRIRHLCLSVAEGVGSGNELYPSTTTFASSDSTYSHSWVGPDTQRQQYAADIGALIRLVAPDLESLCFVHCHGWFDITSLSDVECGAGGFPALREFMLVGSYPFAESLSEDCTTTGPALPRLEKLHLMIPGAYVSGMELTPWPLRAPALAHLMISNVLRVPQGLCEILGTDDRASDDQLPFSGLRTIIIQLRADPPRLSPGSVHPGRRIRRLTKERWESIGNASRRPVVFATPDPKLWEGAWEEVALTRWLDRLQGGPGRWDA